MKPRLLFALMLFMNCVVLAQHEAVIVAIDKDSAVVQPSDIFFLVEEMPVFSHQNGMSAQECISAYLNEKLPPGPVKCKGTIYFQFIVEPDGTTSNFNVLRGIKKCPGIEKTVEQLVYHMPLWKPGKQGGRNVRVAISSGLNIHPGK